MTRIFENNKKKRQRNGIGIRTIIWYSSVSIAAVMGVYLYFFLIPAPLSASESHHRVTKSIETERQSRVSQPQGLRAKQEDVRGGTNADNQLLHLVPATTLANLPKCSIQRLSVNDGGGGSFDPQQPA
eukprot:13300103-Ditylum_brightwellii.AAC.1